MLSRVAENVFWLSRYLERLETTASLINSHTRLLMDLPDVAENEGWLPLITINGLDVEYRKHFSGGAELDVVGFLIADRRNPSSFKNVALAISNNLRSSRDIFPRQIYERISSLTQYIRSETSKSLHAINVQEFLSKVEQSALEISGAVHGSLRHDQAYQFMRMASFLERADMTTRVLDVPSFIATESNLSGNIAAFENRDWIAALKCRSALQMYRRHVRKPISAVGCLNFLLKDPELPTACAFCLIRLDRSLNRFERNEKARESVSQVMQHLEEADIHALAEDPQHRHRFLDDLQLGLSRIGSTIATTYFPPPVVVE